MKNYLKLSFWKKQQNEKKLINKLIKFFKIAFKNWQYGGIKQD